MSRPPGRFFRGGAVQVIEQDIAVMVVVRLGAAGAVLQQDMAFHAQLRRERRRLAGVVRLRRALGHDQVGALRLGLGHQELQLAGLVAAGGKAGAVVALDPDLGSPPVPRSDGRDVPAASADGRDEGGG